ncbi:MAG: heat-shock protein [Rhodospirillales bacterium]|jgi:ribosome-associated heat shock protein Hsp15|nr:heat-shock protein [Rhodospirillales bacterium]
MTREAAPVGSLRIDKFLWYARLAKSRALATQLCAVGAVTLGGITVGKPSQAVRVGDVVTVPRGRLLHEIRILALGSRRGPPAEARLLYVEVAPPLPLRDRPTAWLPLLAGDEHDAAP